MSRSLPAAEEKLLDDTLALGESFGLDQAAAFLLVQATKEFTAGRDDQAKALRSLAQELQAKADARYIHPDPFTGREGGRGK